MWKFLRLALAVMMVIGAGLYLSLPPVAALDMSPSAANITITVRPILAPTVTNGAGATNIGSSTARLNGEVTNTGNENPAATVYYGTSDGSDNATAWSNNVSLGIKALGAFYYDAGGLLPSTAYYYRMYVENSAGGSWALTSANFTTLVLLDPPSGLTVTDLGCITVSMNWSKGAGSTYTMIRGKRNEYPTGVMDGELIYYGEAESDNSTGYALETTDYYFKAWGFAADNITYSNDYATANIGGEGMTEVAEAIDNMAAVFLLFQGLILLIPLIAMSVFSFWKENYILFLITAAIALITGLNAPDILTGASETSALGKTVGLMLLVYAFLCMGWAFKLMFWKEENEG